MIIKDSYTVEEDTARGNARQAIKDAAQRLNITLNPRTSGGSTNVAPSMPVPNTQPQVHTGQDNATSQSINTGPPPDSANSLSQNGVIGVFVDWSSRFAATLSALFPTPGKRKRAIEFLDAKFERYDIAQEAGAEASEEQQHAQQTPVTSPQPETDSSASNDEAHDNNSSGPADLAASASNADSDDFRTNVSELLSEISQIPEFERKINAKEAQRITGVLAERAAKVRRQNMTRVVDRDEQNSDDPDPTNTNESWEDCMTRCESGPDAYRPAQGRSLATELAASGASDWHHSELHDATRSRIARPPDAVPHGGQHSVLPIRQRLTNESEDSSDNGGDPGTGHDSHARSHSE